MYVCILVTCMYYIYVYTYMYYSYVTCMYTCILVTCMYTCILVTCMYTCIRTYRNVRLPSGLSLQSCIPLSQRCVCVDMQMYIYASVPQNVHICIYIHIYTYMHVYIHVYAHPDEFCCGQARKFLFILFVVWESVCGLFIGLFQYMDLHTFIYMYTHPYMYLHPCIQMYADMHVWFIVFVVREREWVVYWYLSSTYVYTYMRIYTYKYLHPHTSTYMLICIYDYSVCCVCEREWVGYWYCFCNHYTMHQVSIHLALAVW